MPTSQPTPIVSPIEQLNDRIYSILFQRLINRELLPGERVVIDDLAYELGTSITPVRESLYRLQEEGLLTRTPYKGWTVRVFKKDEVAEIYQVRAALESFAAELCCSRVETSMLQHLYECQALGEEVLAKGDLDEYRTYNDSFHRMITHFAGNKTLANMMQTIRNQVLLFSSQTIQVPGRPQKAIIEHQDIIQLIESRDAARAARAMQHHVLSALEDVLGNLRTKEKPEVTEKPPRRMVGKTAPKT